MYNRYSGFSPKNNEIHDSSPAVNTRSRRKLLDVVIHPPTPQLPSKLVRPTTTTHTSHQSLDTFETLDVPENHITEHTDNMADFSFITPEPFTGDFTKDPLRWLNRYDQFCTLKNIPIAKQPASFQLLLRDNALNWFEALPEDEKETMESIRNAFKERYGPSKHSAWARMTSVMTRAQSRDEKVADYIDAMRNQCSLAGVKGENEIQAILHGLRPNIRSSVMQSNPQDIPTLREKALLAETAMADDTGIVAAIADVKEQLTQLTIASMSLKNNNNNNYNSAFPRKGPSGLPGPNADRRQRTWDSPANRPFQKGQCGRCGKFHSYPSSQCKAARLICRNCNKVGHLARVCLSGRRSNK